MSVRVLTQVWEHSQHAGTDLLMLLALADFSDDNGDSYPAVPTLAAKCRMTPRNANLILAALRESGELEVRQNEGPRGTNRYRITLAAIRQPLKPASSPNDPQPLKPASPLKNSSPLKPASSTPEAGFPKPLKPIADEPSVNRHPGAALHPLASCGRCLLLARVRRTGAGQS